MSRRGLLAVLSLLALGPLLGCRAEVPSAQPLRDAVGDVARGRGLVDAYGCGKCHEVPGVRGAEATVGPPLHRFGRRVYAGGRLNTPPQLVQFLMNPQSVDADNPMPAVGLTERDAADVAAFLYSL